MSVSIALLPVALAIRVVMGKDNFESWVESQQVRVPTNFESELDLAITVKKAGYDAIKYGSSIKTHLQGEQTFFFWEKVGNQWQAVFSKYHEQAILDQFVSDIELIAGKKVFSVTDSFTENHVQYPTNFRDGTMLMEALLEFGAKPVRRKNGQIICTIENSTLLFTQTDEQPYQVEITNSPMLEDVYQYLSHIDEDYKRCVQTSVYEKLKSRAEEKNMIIEQEEILEDNSIVITLNVSQAKV